MDKKKKFLEKYEQLCRQYMICIDSCGCCGSPWVKDLKRYLRKNETLDGKLKKHIEHLKLELGG